MTDDSGLPPVHVEIPDDLRELDPEVKAYHREQRQHRRRALLKRLVKGPLTPIIALAVLLTTISATLLIVLTPKMPVEAAGRLPDLKMRYAGKGGGPVNAREIRRSLLLLGAETCACDALIAEIVRRAAGVSVYVVTSGEPVIKRSGIQIVEPTKTLDRTFGARGLTAVVVRDAAAVMDVRRGVTTATELETHVTELRKPPTG